MNRQPSLFCLKEIGKEYNDEMLAILKESPVESEGLTICFDREPDIFLIPALKSDYTKCVGFFRGRELLGFAMFSYQNAYVNRKPQTVMYFCNVYVKKEGRHQRFVFKAAEYLLEKTYNNANLGYTIVMKGNKPAESYISRRDSQFPSMAFSKLISFLDVKNIILTRRKKQDSKYKVRHARHEDIDVIVALLDKEFSKRLFAPVIDREKFLQNLKRRPDFNITNYFVAEKCEEIVGVCAAWDTSAFRQNKVIFYRKSFKIKKIFFLLLGALFRFPRLPREGEAFRDVTITDCTIRERNPEIMEALLLKIYNEYREKKYNTLIFGSYYNDPLLKAAKKFFHKSVFSNIIMFSKDELYLEDGKIDTSMPYIDIALL
jgi:hypothetical protein